MAPGMRSRQKPGGWPADLAYPHPTSQVYSTCPSSSNLFPPWFPAGLKCQRYGKERCLRCTPRGVSWSWAEPGTDSLGFVPDSQLGVCSVPVFPLCPGQQQSFGKLFSMLWTLGLYYIPLTIIYSNGAEQWHQKIWHMKDDSIWWWFTPEFKLPVTAADLPC